MAGGNAKGPLQPLEGMVQYMTHCCVTHVEKDASCLPQSKMLQVPFSDFHPHQISKNTI